MTLGRLEHHLPPQTAPNKSKVPGGPLAVRVPVLAPGDDGAVVDVPPIRHASPTLPVRSPSASPLRRTCPLPSPTAQRVSPHTIPHTTATHLLRSGVDINTIGAWLGHVSLATSNV